MKLFKITNNTILNQGYKGAIVAAPSEAEARKIHPDGVSVYSGGQVNGQWSGEWGSNASGFFHQTAVHNQTWPNDLSKITVTQIGLALPSQEKGVIAAF